MNNDTKNKLTSGTDQSDLTSGNACWETPPLLFQTLNARFGPFDVDLTADAQRHLCPTWFGPDSPVAEYDALTAMWHYYGLSGYSNPPYGPFIQRLLGHAKSEARLKEFRSTLLLPMRVTKAFKAHILNGASDLLFCDARIPFFENGLPRLNEKQWREKGKAVADAAVFDSIVVRYQPGSWPQPRVGIFEMAKLVTALDLERAVTARRLKEAA